LNRRRPHSSPRFLMILLCAVVVVGGIAAGCAGGNLKVKKIDSVAQPPANIAVYFTVATETGDPVPDLQTNNFKISEGGKVIPEKTAKRMLLDPRVAMSQSTLVLIDMSGPVVDSEDMPELMTAVRHLVERLSRLQQVAVSVFDGSDELAPVLGFAAPDVRHGLESMRTYRPRRRTSNLNGAIMEGLAVLEKQHESAQVPHAFGNLVIFTDRGDQSRKYQPGEVKKAIDKSDAGVYVIAVGAKVNREEMQALARGGFFFSLDPKDLTKGFTSIGKRMDDVAASHYVLSYCSTKKKGNQTMEVEVVAPNDTGHFKHKFNSDGFKPASCSPKKRPIFEEAAKSR
jgi:hypothetical protein